MSHVGKEYEDIKYVSQVGEGVDISRVEIVETRIIQVDGQYHITSSYGYAGIEPGIVKVVGIRDVEYMHTLDKRDSVDAWIDSLYGMEDNDYKTLEKLYEEDLWVEYVYIYGTNEQGPLHMPMHLFIAHTSSML